MKPKSSLSRNTLLNLLGQGIPAALGFFILPLILHLFGSERMGVLTTLWVVMGYFLLLDLGLGRAVIHFTAEKYSTGNHKEIGTYFIPTLLIIGGVTVVGGLALFFLAPTLVTTFLNVSSDLTEETITTFRLVGLSLPLMVLATCFRGLLEAKELFLSANLLHALSSGANIYVPCVAGLFSRDLRTTAWVLLISRLVLLGYTVLIASREFPELWKTRRTSQTAFSRLFRFGAWSTVTNIVGPIMVFLDQLIVSAQVPASLLPAYALPHEAVVRLLILPNAVSRALFPRLSSISASNQQELSRRTLQIMTLSILPIVTILVYFSDEILLLWLGNEYSVTGAPILKVLAVGFFFNAIAQIPFTQIQSLERPDVSALIHLLELPFYIGVLLYLTAQFGPMGAACAWTLRVLFDCFVLFFVLQKLQGEKERAGFKLLYSLLILLPCLIGGIFISLPWLRYILGTLVGLFSMSFVWFFWLDSDTRRWISLRLSNIPFFPQID